MLLSSSLHVRMLDARRTGLAEGAATLLSSHAGHPRPATSDTTTGSQAHRPTASKRVSSPPVGTISTASDITDDPNPNSKPQGQQSLQVAPRGLGFRFAKALLEALPRLLVSTPIVS